MSEVKVCGVTSVVDAEWLVDAGVSAIGLNFWSRSPRRVEPASARAIVEAVRGRVELVGVFVDADYEEIISLRRDVGFEWVQLHGNEPPALLAKLLPTAYKALRVRDDRIREEADQYGGERLLLDAYVPGALPGGTGQTFDWGLAEELARRRALTLAGGLLPENVGAAVRRVRPARVDVASGVEAGPGRKDPYKVRDFIAAVRQAV